MNKNAKRRALMAHAGSGVLVFLAALVISGCEMKKESAPEPYACEAEKKELGCDAAPEREWPIQVVFAGKNIGSVNPPARRVCPGDKIRWRSAPPKNFVRWDVADSPVVGPCTLSASGVLLCDVKDKIESDCYKYSVIAVAGDKALDPHIIVE